MSAPSRIAAIIPTADRAVSLAECLRSLAASQSPIQRVIVIDASSDKAATRQAVAGSWPFALEYMDSPARGSAGQRNLGLRRLEGEDGVLFLDDDAVVEPDCIGEMLEGFRASAGACGVAANISNQPVGRPGRVTRLAILAAGGGWHASYDGRLLGPAICIRPSGSVRERFLEIDWASTTCVLYRRDALPAGGFRSFFSGYSLGEDVALSLDVRRNGKLLYASGARIIHTPRASSKPAAFDYGMMEVLNREYLTREVLGRRGVAARWGLWIWIAWEWLGSLGARRVAPAEWRENWRGRGMALREICARGSHG